MADPQNPSLNGIGFKKPVLRTEPKKESSKEPEKTVTTQHPAPSTQSHGGYA